jgi:hypothetical protein
MGKGRKIRQLASVVMVMAVTAAISAYAEPVAEAGGYIGNMDSIRDYEGGVTDEMMEEGENDTESSTDLYGSEIGWNIQGSGNEDGAGYETEADRMEAPTYSEKEQEEILENLQAVEETETAGKGWLCIKGNLGDEWPGYNITVALYNSRCRRVEITLYSQDDFVAKRELTIGTYKVYRAYVPGDENGSHYPLVVSDSSIEVKQGKIGELMVWRAEDISIENKITESQYQEEREPEPSANSADIQAAAGIGLVLLFFLVFGIRVYRKKINGHRYQ